MNEDYGFFFLETLAKKFSLFSSDIGIDLGTATVLVYVGGRAWC